MADKPSEVLGQTQHVSSSDLSTTLADSYQVDGVATSLDQTAASLRTISSDLGITGDGADAAWDQFTLIAQELNKQADHFTKAATVARSAQEAVQTAKAAYEALPSGDLEWWQKAAVAAGGMVVAGPAGAVTGAVAAEIWGNEKEREREEAARRALDALTLSMSDASLGLPDPGHRYPEPSSPDVPAPTPRSTPPGPGPVTPFGPGGPGGPGGPTTGVRPDGDRGELVPVYTGPDGPLDPEPVPEPPVGPDPTIVDEPPPWPEPTPPIWPVPPVHPTVPVPVDPYPSAGTSGHGSADGGVSGTVPGTGIGTGIGGPRPAFDGGGPGAGGSGAGGALAGGLGVGGAALGAVGLGRAGGRGGTLGGASATPGGIGGG
ncbi:MAG: hypothetical protein JWP95_2223, partial [Actinotalea sp.]|nr:hypothetical protein [Actinotalea sp.]